MSRLYKTATERMAATVEDADGAISKPLSPELFVDHRPLLRHRADDPTGDLALNAEMRWEAMSDAGYLTPTDRFFVRNHAPTPEIDPLSWTLMVEGPGVKRPLRLGYDDLLRLPAVSVIRALECAGNGRVFFEERHGRRAKGTAWRLGAVGVAEWTGVPLREVLERAGIKNSAREMMAESLDAARMRRPLPVEKALEDDVILAYAMNGEELPADHGFPVRLVVPGWSAVASVKWVGRIHVSEAPLYSPWNTDKYVMTGGSHGARREPVTAQVPKSALEHPWPARLRRGRHILRGRSWSPRGGISRVECRIDGAPWQEARLEGPNLPGAWARWSFGLDARFLEGEHEIRVRATDEFGDTQPERAPWNDLGYLYGAVVPHPVIIH